MLLSVSQELAALQDGMVLSGKANPDIHLSAQVVIFESVSTVGGVWAKERHWPGMTSDFLLGSFEFSDFPMDPMVTK